MTEPRDILTTVRPQDRIPSHGRQLTVDGTPGPGRDARFLHGPAYCLPSCPLCPACPRCGFIGAGHVHSAPPAPGRLSLWDTSADSIPETWSL